MPAELTHDRVDCFNLAGGYIYYQKNSADEPALKRMALDGSNVEIVASGNYTHINATSRYVYFTAFLLIRPHFIKEGTFVGGGQIVQVIADKLVEIVASGNYTHINATSRYVYFTAFESDAPVYRTPVSGAVACTDGVLRGAGDVNVYMAANLINLGFRVAFANLCAPFFTRSGCPAPRFWAVKVDTAFPVAIIGTMQMDSMRMPQYSFRHV